jgi:hypothetical protein
VLGEAGVIDQPGAYTLTVDAVWCNTECADCRAEIKAGDIIGMRPVEGSKNCSLSLCEACVRKELERRATWVRETLPGLQSLAAAAHATLMRDEEMAMRAAGMFEHERVGSFARVKPGVW